MYDRMGYDKQALITMATELLAKRTSDLYYVDPDLQPLIEVLAEIIAELVHANTKKALQDYSDELSRGLSRY